MIVQIKILSDQHNIKFMSMYKFASRNDLLIKDNGKACVDVSNPKIVKYLNKNVSVKSAVGTSTKIAVGGNPHEQIAVQASKESNKDDIDYWRVREIKEKALIAELKRKELEKNLVPAENFKALIKYCDLIGLKMTNYIRDNSSYFEAIGIDKIIDDINMFIKEAEIEVNKML